MLSTIIIFLAILGILIFVHEFGHFLAARRAGLRVDEFGFGFPPRIFGIRRRGTLYSINLIPLGGFVKIYGEDGRGRDDPKSFASRAVWQRSVIVVAGVVMNFVLAILLLSFGFKIGLPQVLSGQEKNVKEKKIQIVSVAQNSPAKEAGLKIGDEILSLSGQKFEAIEEFKEATQKMAGSAVALKIKRAGVEKEIILTPRISPPKEEGAMGVALVQTGVVSYPFFESIWRGISTTFSLSLMIVVTFYEIIKNLVLGRPLVAELSGPVGIAVMTHQAAKQGFVYLLQFVALLSINLAIINILPFPALDGGRILFLIIEKIRRRPVTQKLENLVHTIGFAILILLMIFVTFRDVTRFKDLFINLWRKIVG